MPEQRPSYVPMQPFAAATIEFLTSMSEAELQSSIIEPLLRLQGYTHVRDTSGPNDKGKDLVAIRQEFGKTKLYAIQVKKFRFSGKHSSPRALTNALTQFRQIFGEPVIDPTINEKRFADREGEMRGRVFTFDIHSFKFTGSRSTFPHTLSS